MRSQVIQLGRVRLSDVEVNRISWTRGLHMALVWVTLIVVVGVIVGNQGSDLSLIPVLPELCPFLALALADVASSAAYSRCKPRPVAARICQTVGKLVISFVLFTLFFSNAWEMFASTGIPLSKSASNRLNRINMNRASGHGQDFWA